MKNNQDIIRYLVNEFNKHEFLNAYNYAKNNLNNFGDNFLFLKILGISSLQLNKFDETIIYLSKAISLNDQDIDIYINLGAAFINIQKFNEAINILEKSIIINNKNEMIYNNIGIAYTNLNNNNLAIINFLEAIKINPNYLDALYNLGVTYSIEGDYLNSNNYLTKVIKINNKYMQSMYYYGVNLRKLKDYESSLYIFNEILKKTPNDDKILYNIGRIYQEQKDHIKAKKFFLNSLKFNHNSKEVLNSLGVSLLELDELDQALKLFNNAIDIDKNFKFPYNNIALIKRKLGKINEAINFYNKALNLDKNFASANLGKSVCLFQNKKFKQAWELYDSRIKTDYFLDSNLPLTLINSKLLDTISVSKDSKILVMREQGLGDEILYSSMYNEFYQKFKNIKIECDERLVPLFISSFPLISNDVFVKKGTISANENLLRAYDYVVYNGSLCKFFRNSSEDFNREHHLSISKEDYNNFVSDIPQNNKLNIGISWRSFSNRTAKEKSLNLNKLMSILASNKFNFFNFQYGDVDNEISNYNQNNNNQIIKLNNLDLYKSIYETACLLKKLDLYIGVSNTTAHLACSLGVPSIIICPNFFYSYYVTWYQNARIIAYHQSISDCLNELEINFKDFCARSSVG